MPPTFWFLAVSHNMFSIYALAHFISFQIKPSAFAGYIKHLYGHQALKYGYMDIKYEYILNGQKSNEIVHRCTGEHKSTC